MKYGKFSVTFVALMAGISLPAMAHATSIKDAMAKAYINNPSLLSARSQLESTAELLPQAYAGFLPRASIGYEKGREQQELTTRKDDNQIVNKQIQATQPLFNGFSSVAEVSRAQNLITAEQYRLLTSEQKTLSDAVTAYIDVVRAQEVLQLNTNNVQVLTEQLQATNERFQLGETTRTDVAQAEARLSRATADKTVAEGNLVAAKANYVRVVGEDPVDVKMPTSLPGIPSTLTQAIDLAVKNNPNVLYAKDRAEAADDDVDIAYARLLPNASLVATKRREEGLASFFGSTDRDIESVTVNVNIPLYQSGDEYSKIRQNKRTREQREREYEETKNQIVESVTKSWEDVRTTRATIKSTTDAVNAAKVALDGVKQEAAVGSRTVLDILDAEQELFTTQVNLVSAQRNEVIATHSLLAAIGELTAENMALQVQTYDPNAYKNSVKYRIIGF